MSPSFADLHQQDFPLILPNAWDVSSALAYADAGYGAIGTTSFGVAATAGRPDGGRTSKTGTIELAKALQPLRVYVTVDIEDGYSDDPDEVAEFVAGLGVAGINIEDSTAEMLIDPSRHAAKIAAIKERAPEVFINARADNFWLGQDATARQILIRAEAYVDAGADGFFAPGVTDEDDLRLIAAEVPLPVNVLAHTTFNVEELGELGIRRVSTGSLPYRAAIDAAVNAANALRDGKHAPAATAYDIMQSRLINFRQL
jgi:2-methylisocitrate lyase-like PEP mutase family enzyme